MTIPILYEDDDILVLDKPAGITVNNSETTKAGTTVQDFTASYLHIPPDGVLDEAVDTEGSLDTPEVFFRRAGIAHRIDKETSGILLVAKNPQAFFKLLRQFRERTVHKSYTALAHGKITPPDGEIRVPVGRLTWNRKRFGVIAGGRESVTKYHVRAYYDHKKKPHETYSLVHVFPETGRTHQIRVHLKYIYHPIVSDELYGGRKTARSDRKMLARLFLHASEITFFHPKTGEEVHFVSQLPEDLQAFITNYTKPVEQEEE